MLCKFKECVYCIILNGIRTKYPLLKYPRSKYQTGKIINVNYRISKKKFKKGILI